VGARARPAREAVGLPRRPKPPPPGAAAAPRREAGADEAAVPPRGAPGDAPRLEDDDAPAALRQAERRRQPRQPAPDDADLGLDLAVERAPSRRRVCGASVIAVDMFRLHVRAGRGSPSLSMS